MRKLRANALVIAFAVVFAASFVFYLLYPRQQSGTQYSSTSIEDSGIKAIYLTLERLGFDLGRKNAGISDIPEDGALVVFAPEMLANAMYDFESVALWLDSGGTIVIVGPGQDYCKRLQDELGYDFSHLDRRYDELMYFYDMDVGDGMLRVTALKEDDYQNGVLSDRLVNTSHPNVERLVHSLWDLKDRRLYFEESTRGRYDPGTSGAARDADEAAVYSQPLALFVFQLCVFGLIFVFMRQRRLGPPISRRADIYRRQNEDVLALSELLSASGSHAHAALICYTKFFSEKTGQYPDLDHGKDALFPQIIESSWHDTDTLRLLKRVNQDAVWLASNEAVSHKFCLDFVHSVDILSGK